MTAWCSAASAGTTPRHRTSTIRRSSSMSPDRARTSCSRSESEAAMPAALYGVSFKKTAHLLAIASFEKRELPDATAATQLLQDLVGQGLVISAWQHIPIKV